MSGLVDRARTRLFGTVVGVRTEAPVAALTFDDGPDPESTPALLELLARHGAKATFFLIGKRAAKHPDLVERLVAEGHAIGNHSWDHPSLPELPVAGVTDQLRRTAAAIRRPLRLMRPPYGDQSLASHLAARRLGYTVVLWGIVGVDWADDDGPTIAGRILGSLKPGDFVLLHDTLACFTDTAYRDRGPMLEAVETVLTARPDWGFLTVPEIMSRGRPRRRYWIKGTDPGYLASLKFHSDLTD